MPAHLGPPASSPRTATPPVRRRVEHDAPRLAAPTLDALFTVTLGEDGTCSFDPPSQHVLRGGDVTLVAAGAKTIPVVALRSASGEPFQPFGGSSSSYEATAAGTRYQLEWSELSTGFLKVPGDIVTTSPTGMIVPVAPMWLTSSAFTPRVVDVTTCGKIQLMWTGVGLGVKVSILRDDHLYPLFGGTGTYLVPAKGELFTVDEFAPEGRYTIVYTSVRPGGQVPVRGTIHVTARR